MPLAGEFSEDQLSEKRWNNKRKGMVKINFSRKGYLGVMIILVVTFVAGLGTINAQDYPEELPMEELETPTEVSELINLFERLDYRIEVYEGGERVQDSLMEYEHQGMEEVQGIEADVLGFSMTAEQQEQKAFSSLKIWHDGEEIIQMDVDGEIIPAEMAGMMGETMITSIMFPFYNFADLTVETFAQRGDVSRSQQSLFGREVDVIRVELEDMVVGGVDSAIIRLAEFEDFVMAISYDYSSSEEDLDMSFEVENLKFR